MLTIGRMMTALSKTTLLMAMACSVITTSTALASNRHAEVVTTQTTFASVQSGPVSVQGVKGGIAVNQFGDLFVPSFNGNAVIEFPADGSAPVPIFTLAGSAAGLHVGGLVVDAKQNLFLSTIYVGAQTSTDSAVFEFPYVNGAYPAPVTYSGPLAQCPAKPTTACSWGNYLEATGYYYQPWDIAVDGNGVGYLVTTYDNHANSEGLTHNGGITIYACNAACEARTQNATILVDGLPNPILSIAADFAGDVFYADGTSNVYEVAAGTTTPVAISSGFTSTLGVRVDRAGNLYVSDIAGLYEIPRVGGAYSAASQFKISTLGDNNAAGVGVDIHGNIYAANGYFNIVKLTVNDATFPAAATGTGSSTQNFQMVFNTDVSSAAITASGAEGGEFQLSASTCGDGGTTGGSCSFTGTFEPKGVGLRKASLAVTDAEGNSTAVALAGLGQGAGLTVDPGTLTQIGTGLKAAAGLAIDAAGNVFVADTAANTVYEYAAGGAAAVKIGNGLVAPKGVAVDGGGNVYVADAGGTGSASGRVVEISIVGGALITSSQTVVATGFGTLKGLFVDGLGTLYVADSANRVVYAIAAAQFGGATSASAASFGNGLTSPADVALDDAGNLYIADPGGNQVVRLSPEGVQTPVGSGLSAPTGVAVDASGSVLIADQGNKRLLRVPNEAGILNANDQISIETAIGSPYAVRSDASGDLVVSDSTANVLDTLSRTHGSLTFASVNVGTTSSAQTATLSSAGNVELTLGSPLYGAPGGEFSLVQGVPECTQGGGLAVGFTCELNASFAPTVKGLQTATVPFSSTALNAAAPSLTLSGTGLFLATASVTLAQSSPVGTPAYGQTITLAATVTGSVADGGTPTGTAALTVDGALQPAVALVNGTASFTASGLSGGNHTLTVEYSGDSNYAAAHSANLVITITPAVSTTTLAIAADATTPLSSAKGNAVTFSSTLVPSQPGFFSGTVNYMSGSTVLASAPVLEGANGGYTATVTTTTLPVGTYQVVAVYGGNANYTGATSAAIALTVVATPTIVLASSTGAITSSLKSPGSTTITVTSYAGFQGAVDFACSGLPANATCQFRPAILTLLAGGTSTPLTVPALTTTLSILVNQPPLVTPTSILPWSGLLLLLLLTRVRRMRRSMRMVTLSLAGVCMLSGMSVGLSGCGGTSFKTPVGSSTVTVTATATPSTPSVVAGSSAGTVTSSFTLSLAVQK